MKKNYFLNNPNLIIGFGFVLLVCLFFYPVLFQGKTFGSPDSLGPKAGGIILKNVAEETGEYPLWQPWIFSGMPTAEAFTNISNLYFPYYLFRLLFIKGIFSHLIHLLFAGIGGYVLLRYLRLSRITSFLAGAGFMLMPYMITMEVFGHGSQLMTAAYIPWIFWAVLRVYDRQSVLDTGILAILLGFQLQRAHAQIAYYTWMLIGAFVLYRLLLLLKQKDRIRPVMKSTGLFAGAVILAISMAILVYLPSIEYSPFSVRGAGVSGGAQYNYATSWSFHPKEMLTFFIPSAYGFGGQTYWGNMPFTDYPNYMGIIILVLAIIGLVQRRDQLKWFLLITSLLAILISFGKHFGLVYNLFYNFFPYFNKFRVPHMILILLQFNIAVLAAFGLECLTELKEKEVPRWVWVMVGLLGLIVLSLVLGGSSLETMVRSKFIPPRSQDPRAIQTINSLRWDMWYKDAWLMVLFGSALIGLIWLWIRRSVNQQVLLSGIVALAIIDIGIVDYKIIQPGTRTGRSSQLISKRAIDRYFKPDEVIQFLQTEEDPFRIYPAGQLFGESRFKAFGIESVGGYHPAKLKIYNEFLEKTRNAGTLPLMRMLNVRYLLSSQAISHPELMQKFKGKLKSGKRTFETFVYQIKNSLLRAWFVDEITILDNPEQIWSNITKPDFNPSSIAYVTKPIELPADFGRGNVQSISTSINRITIQTDSEKTGFLVVSEVYYPLRWNATVDGEPVETFETNGVIRGLIIPAGKHIIEFNYDRSSFLMGIKISIAAFIFSLGVVCFGFFSERKSG